MRVVHRGAWALAVCVAMGSAPSLKGQDSAPAPIRSFVAARNAPLFYTTATVAPEDGALHFAQDIYRHDTRLDRALKARR